MSEINRILRKEYELRRDVDSIFVDTYYHGASNNERRIIEEEAQQKLWNYAHTREAFGCTWTMVSPRSLARWNRRYPAILIKTTNVFYS